MDNSPEPRYEQAEQSPHDEKRNIQRALLISLLLCVFVFAVIFGLKYFKSTSSKALTNAELRSIIQSGGQAKVTSAEQDERASNNSLGVKDAERESELNSAKSKDGEDRQKASQGKPSESKVSEEAQAPLSVERKTYPIPFEKLPYEDSAGKFKVREAAYGPQRSEYSTLLEWIKAMQNPEPNLADGQYAVLVFLKEQVLAVYDFSNPDQRVLLRAFACSSGEVEGWTPQAQTQIGIRHEEGLMFDGSFGMYCSQINGNILIHSVPSYGQNGQVGVKTTDWNNLGKAVSHGCVRLSFKGAKFIYDNLEIGSPVTVLADASAYPEIPQGIDRLKVPEDGPEWDPTNPNPENPYYQNPELLLPVNQDLPLD